MKKILFYTSKAAGITLMVLAFLQWITFDYPDVNPFFPGAIFASGMLGQFVNYFFVSFLAVCGVLLFKLEKFLKK